MNQFRYSRPELDRLVSKLRIRIKPRYVNMKQPDGPQGRLNILREVVNGVIKYERLELGHGIAEEARGYVERLISEAIRHGETHKETMDMANYWIKEKQYIHKLFKVLVPRFQDYQTAYTNFYKAPLLYPESYRGRSLIELKGNPFPPMIFDGSRNKSLIHNVLLDEARKEHYREKKTEIAQKVKLSESEPKMTPENTESVENMSKAAKEVSESEELLKATAIENKIEVTGVKEEYVNNTVPIV